MPHDTTHVCERCRRYTDLFYVRSVDEYLCEDCLMLLAKEVDPDAEPDND